MTTASPAKSAPLPPPCRRRRALTIHDSLRRRFEQNQEDCTFTVLAILPTATDNILQALPVEQTLSELQKQKAERLQRSVAPSDIASTDAPSEAPSAVDDDNRSLKSFQSESIVHASQVVDRSNGDGKSEGAFLAPPKPKKSKAQLWNDMKIHCRYLPSRQAPPVDHA